MVHRAVVTLGALALAAALAGAARPAAAGGPVLVTMLSAAGMTPRDVAVSPDGATLYVAVATKGENAGRLLTMAATDGAEVRPDLLVGGEPTAVLLAPGGGWGYVANTGDGYRVTKFRADRGEKVGEARVDGSACGLAFGRDAKEVWVVHGWSGAVAVVDTVFNKPSGGFEVRADGFNRAASATDGRWLWATGRTGRLFRIDPRAKLIAATVSVSAWDVAVSPDGHEVYAACPDATIRVLSAATDELLREIPLPAVPHGLAVTPDGKFLYVSFPREGRVASVDLARGTVAGTAKAGKGPARLAVSPDGRFVYACDEPGAAVAVVATNGHTGPPGAVALMRLEQGQAGIAPPPAAPAALTLAVMNLEPQGVAAGSAAVASDWLRDALVKTGAFTVLERTNMDKVLGEQALQQTGCTDAECAVKLGRVLNVRRMAVGTLGRFEGSYVVSVRVVDVETGVVTGSETARGEAIADVERGVRDLAAKLAAAAR